MNTDAGKEARTYLHEKRGIKPRTEEVWELGYAPKSWDAALNYFKNKGYPIKDVIEVGLLTESQNGKVYDRFRHRVIFPIRNMSGQMAGFGGRILDPDDIPKFTNSPQSILFDKSAILYGLDKARKSIRRSNQAVIVEGYFDVILVHQEGFQNVVSPMGTALTEVQMRMLKRFTRRFILALDPDAAGKKATLRGLEVAREALEHNNDPVFDSRGLLHYETRLQADLRVSTLPDELDPDEIVLRDTNEWERIIQSAKPIIYHVLDSLTSGQDLDDPKVKSTIATQILPLIKDIPNPVERDAYRQKIARILKVDERALLDLIVPISRNRIRRNNLQTVNKPTSSTPLYFKEQEKLNVIEREILAYLIKVPKSKYKIDRFLRSNELGQLTMSDFMNTENQLIAKIIFDSLSQDDLDPVDYITSRMEADPMLTEINSSQMLVTSDGKSSSELRHLEEIARLVMQVRQLSVNQQIKDFRFLQSGKNEGNNGKQDMILQERLLELIKMRGLLDRALSKPVIIE